MKVLLLIRYLGTAYCGFQAQKNGRSIQEHLTKAAQLSLGFPLCVTGCSRTDAGVHALGFVAALEPREPARRGDDWCPVPLSRLHRVMNRFLPDDIAVTAAAPAGDDFHPRYGVVSKTYRYRMADCPARDPFLKGRAWHLETPLSEAAVARMAQAAALYPGRRDFSGFMAAGSKVTDPVRCVTEAHVARAADGCLEFSVTADGFLYNMVRIMAGTLVDAAAGRRSEADIRAALETGSRERAGRTAPPEGLYLETVRYPSEIRWLAD